MVPNARELYQVALFQAIILCHAVLNSQNIDDEPHAI
jgi:hypothetical protein